MGLTQQKRYQPIQTLAALYASLPEIDCKGKCASECTEVPCSSKEAKHAARAAGVAFPPPPRPDGFCPYLNAGRCTVHAARPTICRLYGVWERLPCKYGCKPERMLSDAEGEAVYQRSLELGKET